jgi:hypothetical protein
MSIKYKAINIWDYLDKHPKIMIGKIADITFNLTEKYLHSKKELDCPLCEAGVPLVGPYQIKDLHKCPECDGAGIIPNILATTDISRSTEWHLPTETPKKCELCKGKGFIIK